MLDIESVQTQIETRAGPMPHWITLIHVASGLRVQGNCKLEDSIPKTTDTLLRVLGKLVMAEESSRGKKFQQVQATEREQGLQAQLDEMKAMVAQLLNRQEPTQHQIPAKAKSAAQTEPKKRGGPKGWKKPADDSVPPQADGAQIIDGPIPQVAFGAVPPTTAPPPRSLSKSKGGVVTRSNVDYIQP